MSRRRRHAAPWLSAVIPAAALAGWADLGEMMGTAGLALLMAPALVLAVTAPGLVLSFRALPQLLVPDHWRIEWRREQPRPAIPVWLRRAVYAADRYRCCFCGDRDDLQVDHVKPWSCGGLSALWNLMTLCGNHNKIKSNYWRDRDGYVHYRGFTGSENAVLAAEILAYELRRRWNLLRWLRVGWALRA